MIPKNTHNWVTEFHTRAEAKGSPVSFPMVISYYVYPYSLFFWLIFLFHTFCPLLHINPRRCPCCRPCILHVQASMFQPYLCHLSSRTALCFQRQLKYWTSNNVSDDGVLAAEDICPDLIQTRHQHFRCQRQVFLTPLYIVPWLNPL